LPALPANTCRPFGPQGTKEDPIDLTKEGTFNNPHVYTDRELAGMFLPKSFKKTFKNSGKAQPSKTIKNLVYPKVIQLQQTKKMVEEKNLVLLGRRVRCKSC
jgi:hypothetical protein